MSFRELRSFTESMRALGYRRNVSVDDFRTPNFPLVADCLYWLVHRFDPLYEISDDISTEDARVEFIQATAQFFLSKTRQKLSVKQLYRADGYAVKELLKISGLLYDAVRLQSRQAQADEDISTNDTTLSSKLEEMRQARPLAGEIVQSGSNLFDLLAREEEMRQAREKAMRFLDAMTANLESKDPQAAIERAIRQQINIVEDNLSSLQKTTVALEEDRNALAAKVERKKAEQERLEKRLKGLKQVRPAYMEEYEALEAELKVVYEQYVERSRNLSALERQLDDAHRSEQSRQQQHDRALKRMQRRLREEELRILRGEQDVDENRIDDAIFDSEKEESDAEEEEPAEARAVQQRRQARPQAAGHRQRSALSSNVGGSDAYALGESDYGEGAGEGDEDEDEDDRRRNDRDPDRNPDADEDVDGDEDEEEQDEDDEDQEDEDADGAGPGSSEDDDF